MPLYLIGLGLCDENDITVKGLEIVKKADYVFLELYTSIISKNKEALEAYYERKISVLYRDDIENKTESLLELAKNKIVVLLVGGDPLCATTHSEIVLEAKKYDIPVIIIHNTSIMTSIGVCGLQLYSFGETVSIPFFSLNWKPDSFYDKIKNNISANLHTLCLLDIQTKEQTIENMMKENQIYEPPRFMTIRIAIQQLYDIESQKNEKICTKETKAFGIARLGSSTNEKIVSGTLEQLFNVDFGKPLHSLIICRPHLHVIENDFFSLYQYKID